MRYWEMTPEEFAVHVEAFNRREAREWHRTAWLACCLLAPWSKKKLTPEKLLGRSLVRRRPNATIPEDVD